MEKVYEIVVTPEMVMNYEAENLIDAIGCGGR